MGTDFAVLEADAPWVDGYEPIHVRKRQIIYAGCVGRLGVLAAALASSTAHVFGFGSIDDLSGWRWLLEAVALLELVESSESSWAGTGTSKDDLLFRRSRTAIANRLTY